MLPLLVLSLLTHHAMTPLCQPAHRSNGYSASSTTIKHFWQVVREMGQVR